jgi:hypothetical protein
MNKDEARVLLVFCFDLPKSIQRFQIEVSFAVPPPLLLYNASRDAHVVRFKLPLCAHQPSGLVPGS